jgi:Transposase IS116/IS110/IS902 family
MVFALLYLALRRLFRLSVGSGEQAHSKDVEILVLRHQVNVLHRQAGLVLGPRVLAEFGDDPTRYADPKARKNYAGTSPITKASGRSRVALARFARNRRLADALDMWAFCSLSTSPGARRRNDEHRAKGNTHHQALRALANRWVGILHGCLRRHQLYSEVVAWPSIEEAAA